MIYMNLILNDENGVILKQQETGHNQEPSTNGLIMKISYIFLEGVIPKKEMIYTRLQLMLMYQSLIQQVKNFNDRNIKICF